MYLIQYRLFVGASRHYAPSAKAAVILLEDIKASGGHLTSIIRTRDGLALTADELQKLADQEIGPSDGRGRSGRHLV